MSSDSYDTTANEGFAENEDNGRRRALEETEMKKRLSDVLKLSPDEIQRVETANYRSDRGDVLSEFDPMTPSRKTIDHETGDGSYLGASVEMLMKQPDDGNPKSGGGGGSGGREHIQSVPTGARIDRVIQELASDPIEGPVWSANNVAALEARKNAPVKIDGRTARSRGKRPREVRSMRVDPEVIETCENAGISLGAEASAYLERVAKAIQEGKSWKDVA